MYNWAMFGGRPYTISKAFLWQFAIAETVKGNLSFF